MGRAMEAEDNIMFSIHVAELVRYLREAVPSFPLCDKLLDCGVQAGIALRMAQSSDTQKTRHEQAARAYSHIKNADYIIEMAVTAGYLTEAQGKPIRAECHAAARSVSSERR